MQRHMTRRPHQAGARGAALVVVLFLLVAILLLGASAAQLALQGEKAARGERDWQIAFQAAEEALMDAENDIEGRPGAPGRGAMFAPDSALGFVDGCGAGANNVALGLCLQPATGAPAWQRIDFNNIDADTTRSVPYGKFTGALMPTGQGFQACRPPRYIIELLSYTREGEHAGPQARYFYRITASGFGARDGSQVVLQSVYRKLPPAGSLE